MKKHTTPSSFYKFTYLKLIVLAGILAFNSVCIQATIVLGSIQNIKLTSASLPVTITPNGSTVDDWGVKWSTTSGIYNHTIDVGATQGGSFTVEMTGLDRSKTIYYQVYSTEGATTEYSPESSFINVPEFTGTGNWDDATKWNVGEVPEISGGDSPVINGNCTILNNSSNGSWVCDNLTINPGAKLIISPERTLRVMGVLINSANEDGLLIKSMNGFANGTLTFVSGAPLATVEMFSKAYWDLNQADGSKFNWQYFGIPVSTFSLSDATFNGSIVRKYNETSTDDMGLWTSQDVAIPLTSGTGYELVQQDTKTYVFKGGLTNVNFSKPLVYTAGSRYPGQHIFSNPYTAAIDISAITFGPNTEKSVYLYNTGTYNNWYDNGSNPSNGTSTTPGQYVVTTQGAAGGLGVPTQIPSMQGFLVKNSAPADGSITIPYLSGAISNTEYQRAPGATMKTAADKVVTRIDLSGNNPADCMWIFTDPACSAQFDNGWDGYKMMGSALTPQLYAMETDGDFQIDARDDINGTYLGFKAGTETNYKLTFTHQHADTRYSGLYLVDLVENKTVDITANGSVYSFTAISSPTPVKRFKIVTSTEVATGNLVTGSLIKIINSNGTLVIQNQTNQNGEVTIFTLNGIAVERMTYSANGITTFSTSQLLPGAYVARACTDKEMVTERIIIR